MEECQMMNWEISPSELKDLLKDINPCTIAKTFYLANCRWHLKVQRSGCYLQLLKSEAEINIIGMEYKVIFPHGKQFQGTKLFNSKIHKDMILFESEGFRIHTLLSIISTEFLREPSRQVYVNIVIKSFYGNSRNATDETEILYNLEELFNSSKFSDFTLKASGKNFNVHRNILAARSTVFYRMLTCDMKEKVTNNVEIDVDPDVLQDFLRYVYCGKVENLEKHARELLKLAHMYEVHGLSILCYAQLCLSLTIENVVEIFLLGNDYNIDKFNSHIINFIIDHIDEILNTVDFDKITQNSQLSKEIFRRIAERTLKSCV